MVTLDKHCDKKAVSSMTSLRDANLFNKSSFTARGVRSDRSDATIHTRRADGAAHADATRGIAG